MPRANTNASLLWESWQRLYPVYCTLARELVIEHAPCPGLEEANPPSAETMAQAEQWFTAMDERIRIYHLRQFAQTSDLVNEKILADLVTHILSKEQKGEEDRDKLDFVGVQLFSFRVPARLALTNFSAEDALTILEPVLGTGGAEDTALNGALEQLIAEARAAKDLNFLFTARILERSRALKSSSGERAFEPMSMAVLARFGFLIRRSFFRLVQQDLNTILDGLRELEARGVTTLDCRKAQFGAEEPIHRIRMICQSWRVMYQAEYSSGQPLCLLVDLRTAVDAALAQVGRPAAGKANTLGARAGGK